MQPYVHKQLGTEIKSISGYFTYLEEKQLNITGRKILYLVGIGVIDNSCCGNGGCRFIEVPGYIVSWKTEAGSGGSLISQIERIKSAKDKKAIERELKKLYPYSQINFS